MTSPTSTPIPTPFSKATTTTPLRLLARGNASSIYVYGPSPSNSVILKSVLASSPR
jgi:serine/threonine protein kinase